MSPKACKASSRCKVARAEASPTVLSLGPRSGHDGVSGAFVAVGTFGDSHEHASPGRTVTGSGRLKPASTARRSPPGIRRDLECAHGKSRSVPGQRWDFPERVQKEQGSLSSSCPATVMATEHTGRRAGATGRVPWRPRTLWVPGAVLPVMTVVTAHTIGLQDLQTTPLALETAVTITTVYRGYIIHRLRIDIGF